MSHPVAAVSAPAPLEDAPLERRSHGDSGTVPTGTVSRFPDRGVTQSMA
jgi:hypothetical protein